MNRTLLKTQLVRHEGLRLKPYRCTAGKLTIGVGRNLDDKGISPKEAMLLLDNDIDETETWLLASLPWVKSLDDARQRVLVNMAFNLGVPGLLAFKRTLASVERGEFGLAAAQMLESKWARQVGDDEGQRAWELSQQMRLGRDVR
jgi:lysozyme